MDGNGDSMQIYSCSKRGYSHIRNNIVCQDYSSMYKNIDRSIITCCDGHGGKLYIRSNLGSNFASDAITNVLKRIEKKDFSQKELSNLANKIKLQLLCEWNNLVELDYSKNKIKKKEKIRLNEDDLHYLKMNPVKMYGTTLTASMVYNNYVIVVGIGDSECIYFKKGKVERVFDDESEPVANLTYSLCQDDAYNYINVRIFKASEVDGILLCTDGLSSPFQSYENFNTSFVKTLIYKTLNEPDLEFVDKYIDDLATQYGNGDDVSLAYFIMDKVNKKYYR